MTAEFREFPKIPRLNREVVITEKIDGTNACVVVTEDGQVCAQSRSRIIVPGSDNFGFAAWVADNADELRQLGPGYHYGEWWGKGIQRNYGLDHRRFSLFNVGRWTDRHVYSVWVDAWALMSPEQLTPGVQYAPACCWVVPALARTDINGVADTLRDLTIHGSRAAPGFMSPEGLIVYHTAGGHYYKVLIENDAGHKGKAA